MIFSRGRLYDLIVQQLPSYLKDDKKFGVEKKRKKIKFNDCFQGRKQ